MRSNRISSGTQEHPTPKDLLRALLSRMVECGIETSWTHVEVIADGGWIMNLLSGKQPWIEIALVNRHSLHLNPGVPKTKRALIPGIPEKWRQETKGLWTVPVTDTEELTAWVDTCLTAVSGRPVYRLSGWIEGL